MRVLIISNMAPSPQKPFSGIFVQNQVRALECSVPKGWTIAFHGMPRTFTNSLGSLLKYLKFGLSLVRRHFFTTRYDIIHVHYFMPTILFGLLYKYLRSPPAKLIVTFHGSDVNAGPVWLGRWLIKRVDHVVAVSAGLGHDLAESGLSRDRLSILSAGLAPCFGLENSDSEKAYDLIFVGSFYPVKGFDLLIALLGQLSGLRVCVIGSGPLESLLDHDVMERHKIELIKDIPQADLPAYYAKSRFLVNCSRSESFGLTMAEAMAMGVPVIATRTDGAREQIREGVNGFIASGLKDDDKIDSLERSITMALNLDADRYRDLANAARASAEPYQMNNVVKRLTKIYQDVAASS
jgi:glycosyltransferase involved in cell wall biosynthesis